MDYIFFDTEAVPDDYGILRICSFGYIITNEYFDVKEKKDIIINPGCDVSRSTVSLAYGEESFYSSPTFDYHYNKIKRLLTYKNTVIAGHSASCDASYLSRSVLRYSLEPLTFSYVDTQKIHGFYSGETDRKSLANLCGIYGVNLLREHKSDDDAHMTASVAKAMCEKYTVSFEEMACNKALRGVCFRGVVHDDLSSAFPLGNGEKFSARSKKLLRQFIKSTPLNKKANEKLLGKIFCFGEDFEKNELEKELYLIEKIKESGGECVTDAMKCDILVCPEYQGVRYGISRRAGKKIIKILDLLEMLGIPEKRFSEFVPDTDKIVGNTKENIEWYRYYCNNCRSGRILLKDS